MDIKQIKQLVKLMLDNDLTELEIASGDDKVHLKRAGEEVLPVHAAAVVPAAVGPAAAAEAPAESDGFIDIRSPMVGTFYTAASPDSEPYVQVGDAVGDESVVCVIEAMKVMNEIKAECSGTIVEICAKNAQPVEFGQVLFRVKPSSGA